jgi:hypothetical protein
MLNKLPPAELSMKPQLLKRIIKSCSNKKLQTMQLYGNYFSTFFSNLIAGLGMREAIAVAPSFKDSTMEELILLCKYNVPF